MDCCNNHLCNLTNDSIGDPPRTVATQTSTQPRKCTDVGFLVLLFILTIVDVAIFLGALTQDPPPNPEYLYKGHDYNGDVCHKYTAWIDLDHHHITECVDSCSEVTMYEPMKFEDYWCVPKDKETRSANHFHFSHASDTYLRTIGDLYIVWPLVLVMAIMSIATSLLYLYMIKIHRRLTAYIIMNIVFGLLGGIVLIYHGFEDQNDPLTDNTGSIEVLFGVFNLCLVLIIAIWMHYEREALVTEIEMMAEAIETITNLWTAIRLYSILYSILILIWFAYWIVSTLYIYSVPILYQKDTPADMIDVMNTDIVGKYTDVEISNYKYLLIYHMIFAVHVVFIFCYFGYLVVSHVVLMWYLGKDNETRCGVNWPPKKIQSTTRVEDMKTEDIVQWIKAEMSYDIVSCGLLIDVIEQKKVEGRQLSAKSPVVHYTKLKEWLTEHVHNNNDKISDHRIDEVSDAFFIQVRKRLGNEKKGPTQGQIVWNAMRTIRFYHIGTAALAAWLSFFGVMDIYPYIHAWMQKRKCCFKDDETGAKDTQANASSQGKEMNELILVTFDKEDMYMAYKQKITPLIVKKIQNLSREYMLSVAIDKTMTNITVLHYGKAMGVMPFFTQSPPMTPGQSYEDQDEQKYDPVEAKQIEAAIDDNILDFYDEIEEEIEEDIYKVIERNIDKLKKEIKRKRHELKDKKDENDGRHVTELDAQCLGRIRKEGLIFTSLYGTSFCVSSYNASKLEKANITRLADVQGFSTYNERFGRIGIACTNTALAVIAMFIYDEIHQNISSFVMPTFIIFLISYTIGYIFTSILEATVSTLLFCVIVNEEKWNELFSINQGKIKQNVGGLANSLSAMITEHQLIMQLKEAEVNEKIRRITKDIVAPNVKDDELDRDQKKDIADGVKRLVDVKRKALRTEEQLLHQIDGPMKLTQYLIDVILVENYFNKQYKKDKPEQERAQAKYAKDIFEKEQYENERISFKQRMYNKVVRYKKIGSFLHFYPSIYDDQTKDKQITDTWKRTVKDLESELREKARIMRFKVGEGQKKGIERAFYKSFYSYHDKEDGFRYLTDILRCSIKFVDFENLYRAFQYIHEEMKDKLEILRVKDTFNSPSEPNGYRHLMINVLVKGEDVLEGIICEIQLHHETFYDAKRVSHRMYKKTRLFDTEHGNEAYNYAVKYVRPVIGRFKVYPMDEEQEQIDILDMIGAKLKTLAEKYCNDVVIPHLQPNQGFIVKENIDMSELAKVQKENID
eukprot:1080443_1